MSKSDSSGTDKESRFSLTVKQKFEKHEFQADYDRRSIQKLSVMIESQKEEISHDHQGDERLRRDQLLREKVIEANLGSS